MENNKKILIVGAGPTGLTLACALEKMGISSKIIDMRDAATNIPRAININQLSLGVFKSIGIDENFWSEGLKLKDLIVHWNKKRLLKVNYKYVETSYPYFFHLEQSRLEFYLNELLGSHENSVVRSQYLIDMEQQENDVAVTLLNPSGDTEEAIYSYVIGCDGGDSTVRKLNNIGVNEERYSSYFILIDAELNYQADKLNYYLSEQGYLMIVPLPQGNFRLIASFNDAYPGKENVDISLERFQEVLDERGPGGIEIKKIHWTTSAEFFHKVADQARVGRVFLAGDSLHQFSPVGGTNMNTGIQDAFSLAKKISFQLSEIAKRDVLDAYGFERLPVIKNILKATKDATHLLTRREKSDVDKAMYLPKMKNRKFMQYNLPKMFSGIALQQP